MTVTGQDTAFLTSRSITDRSGSAANRSFQSRGVSAATSRAGWRSTRCNTSTRYAERTELLFHFIRNDNDLDFKGQRWDALLETWLALIPANGRFVAVEGVVTTLEDLTARDYVDSDRLDLDQLTRPGRPAL